ncbi:hypothetical protein QQ020_13260 [Fulvivirgaceae bacterium BMA12]|uniref:Outer membrane protein beta-barrel domain-containing protein n=1 Tax=Agaribacillus aureus TaxID=3051825 RepID=A0ABT8L5N0_9BACT|nr:hypothetical protein [Fulvivirgaceae bacterium BMA12]
MKTLITVILFFLVTKLCAQERMSLRTIPFIPQSKEGVYVESVIDKRKVKSLGIQEKINGEKTELFLKEGAETALESFYEKSLKKDSHKEPVYIELKALNVQESKRRMNDGIVKVARAHVEMSFLQMEDGMLKEMYAIKHNEDEVFALHEKAQLYATHEKRIRAALEYCMHYFLKNYDKVKPVFSDANFTPLRENEKMDKKLGQWFNLVTVKGMGSTYFQGYGISYTGFVDSKKGLIRPYETSFELTWARKDVAEENGYEEVNSFVLRPELYFFYKRLFQGVYASMSTNAPLGFELLEDLSGDNSFNFVIGIGASQGLRFIPWQKRGLVFGVDFFQQFETSEVYRFDLGVEFVLGINF